MIKKKIFICCTEQSGENICFNIIKNLDLNNIQIDGVCGKDSEEYFTNKFFDISEFKSIGIVEILISLKKYIKMIKFLNTKIIDGNYDLVICIDSPDFNYNLVKSLRKKKYSNYILQIVAPTVWAWRKNRAQKFAKIYNEIFVLFNFENRYFQFPNFKCTFIGHPIFHIKKRIKKNNYKYISFLFGSRENEVNKLFFYFDILEKHIFKNNPQLKIFIPTLPHLIDRIKLKTKKWKTDTIITTSTKQFEKYYNDVLISITCSGTASLEIAKRNIPQIVIYKLNIFTEFILKTFVKIKNACLLNIISDKTIIPELTNSNLNKKNLISEFDKLINNESLQIDQLKMVNEYLPEIETKISPFTISANRIKSLL